MRSLPLIKPAVRFSSICPCGDFDNRGSGKIEYDNFRPYGPNGEIVMLPLPNEGNIKIRMILYPVNNVP